MRIFVSMVQTCDSIVDVYIAWQMDKFAVVEFLDENSIGVVPKSWLDQSESQVTTIWAFSLIIVNNSVVF